MRNTIGHLPQWFYYPNENDNLQIMVVVFPVYDEWGLLLDQRYELFILLLKFLYEQRS
jgi:hypothetical protein